jgi:hypothetical protein
LRIDSHPRSTKGGAFRVTLVGGLPICKGKAWVAGLSVFVALLSFRGYRLPDTVNAETVPVRR